MSNPLMASFQQNQTQQIPNQMTMTPMQIPNFNQLYQQFVQNPMKYLGNLNLPQNIQTPEQAVKYLASNGQIPPLIQRQVYSMLGIK